MKNKQASQSGFTLIELLVTIAIAGILTSIALPQYKSYRQRAFDAVVQSDIRSLVLAEENYFLDTQQYLPCENAGCASLPSIIRLSKGVTAKIEAFVDSYKITAKHQQGSRTFIWDSSQGGFL